MLECKNEIFKPYHLLIRFFWELKPRRRTRNWSVSELYGLVKAGCTVPMKELDLFIPSLLSRILFTTRGTVAMLSHTLSLSWTNPSRDSCSFPPRRAPSLDTTSSSDSARSKIVHWLIITTAGSRQTLVYYNARKKPFVIHSVLLRSIMATYIIVSTYLHKIQ